MAAGVERSATLAIEDVRVGAFRIPTDAPESDGTLQWDHTTLVVVEVGAAGERGLGYTYGDAGIARLIADHGHVLHGRDAWDIETRWVELFAALRNLGRQGAAAMAVSALDVALWDLKAKQLGVALVTLFGQAREALPIYGSGGFTSYSDAQLQRQFRDWAEEGITRFKMKVGREPGRDPHRVRVARAAIGDNAELLVDANSAYTRNEAMEAARRFVDEADVRWFEEPLDPEDHDGLRFLRMRVPPQLEIAEGEYGYDLGYFRRLLGAEAVDVVMADATRCGGYTGFRKAAVLCEAARRPLSSHCAPALHLPVDCAVTGLRHAEYFHDHVRIERELFDGVATPREGVLRPDLTRPGHGLDFKWAEAERYAI